MIFNKQNFWIKTIYSPFISVDIFINVNLLYFCITQGMSKLIIQIFINRIFDHVSMVNGNSKLKYCLLVQEEKKQQMKQMTQLDSTMRDYLMFLVRVLVNLLLVVVFCCFNHIKTFLEMEFCLGSYSCISSESLTIFKALQYLPGTYIAYSMVKRYILWIKITSITNPSLLVSYAFYLPPTKPLV